MKDLVIFGTGDIAELAHYYFEKDGGRRVAAFTVDRAWCTAPALRGLPLVPFEELASRFPPASNDLFVAVSYAELNDLRARKVAEGESAGYSIASYVSSRATIWPDLSGRKNLFILEDNTIQPFVQVGHNVTMWSGNHIGHHSTIEDNVFISSHVVVSGHCRIGANSFLGVNATLRDHVTIGARCVLAAGALVVKDCPENGLYLSPAVAGRSERSTGELRRI